MRDVQAALAVLHGQELTWPSAEAAQLLALVAGQDVEAGEDGVFRRIARRVARDRVIKTVDTEARHGHKSRARRFAGYKTHLGVDPDDELITNVTVTAANTPDREVIEDLLDDPGGNPETGDPAQPEIDEPDTDEPGLDAVGLEVGDKIIRLRKQLSKNGRRDAGAETIAAHLATAGVGLGFFGDLDDLADHVPPRVRGPAAAETATVVVAAVLRRPTQPTLAGRHHPLAARRWQRRRDLQHSRRPLPGLHRLGGQADLHRHPGVAGLSRRIRPLEPTGGGADRHSSLVVP